MFNEKDLVWFHKLLKGCSYLYYIGEESCLNDTQYDILNRTTKRLEQRLYGKSPEDSPTVNVGFKSEWEEFTKYGRIENKITKEIDNG